MWFAMMFLALVAGCATSHHHVTTRVVYVEEDLPEQVTPSAPVYYASGADAQLAQAARLAAAYRVAWQVENGGVVTVSGGTISASQVRVDPEAKCPKGQPTAAWTQSQLDACQTQALRVLNQRTQE